MAKKSEDRNAEVSVWKYVIQITDEQVIEMPIGARFLYVNIMDGELCLWAQVWTKAIREKRKILVRGTGHPFTGEEKTYIGTSIHPISGHGHNFVWHVYDGGAI